MKVLLLFSFAVFALLSVAGCSESRTTRVAASSAPIAKLIRTWISSKAPGESSHRPGTELTIRNRQIRHRSFSR